MFASTITSGDNAVHVLGINTRKLDVEYILVW